MSPGDSIPGADGEALRSLANEMAAHQLDLEAQNEELRRVHKEVSSTIEQYIDLYDSAPVAYISLQRGLITRVNAMGMQMLAARQSDLIGKAFSKFVVPGSRRDYYKHQRAARESTSKLSCEIELRAMDGNTIWARMETVASGRSQVRSALVDISDRKLIEGELQKTKEELDRGIKVRTAELEAANETLRREVAERNKTAESLRLSEERYEKAYREESRLRQELEMEVQKRVDFVRALAHELKTPLTAVLAAGSALVSNLPAGVDLDFARAIERAAYHLNSRIDQLLDMAKIEVGVLHVDLAPVDIKPILKEVVDLMEPLANNRHLTLAMRVKGCPPTITGDPEMLRRILHNLLSNACKYTQEGGIITLSARERHGELIIEVSDNGPGISEEQQSKLFQPYQPKGAGHRRSGGLGLGLALSKYMVEMHSGRIWYRSRRGSGSVFGFSIPITKP